MSFLLVYHPDAAKDAAGLNADLRRRLGKAVEQRLGLHPESYGKPLRGSLAGYWSLRVGDYRVVYQIKGAEVWIFGLINRRDVYEDVVKRLGWQP